MKLATHREILKKSQLLLEKGEIWGYSSVCRYLLYVQSRPRSCAWRLTVEELHRIAGRTVEAKISVAHTRYQTSQLVGHGCSSYTHNVVTEAQHQGTTIRNPHLEQGSTAHESGAKGRESPEIEAASQNPPQRLEEGLAWSSIHIRLRAPPFLPSRDLQVLQDQRDEPRTDG